MQTFQDVMADQINAHSLYGGTETIYFNEDKHTYRLGSPDGVRVPGATSISGLAKDPDPLMIWAAEMGAREALQIRARSATADIDSIAQSAKFAWRRSRDSSAQSGTDLHTEVERYVLSQVNGTDYVPGIGVTSDQQISIDAFISYAARRGVKFLSAEQMVFSKEHHFAGTMDILVELEGKPKIWDIKTGKSAQSNHYLQQAGYGLAYAEEHGIEQPEFEIIRLPRNEPGRVARHRGRCELSELTKTFLHLREVLRWRDKI